MEQRSLQLTPPATPPVLRASERRPPWRTVALILHRAALNFSEDRGSHMAAAIAYYALFSLFPIITLAVSIFGFVMRDEARRDRVAQELVRALPVEPGALAEPLLAMANRGPTLTLLAALGTMWSASALLSVVRRSLGVAFAVERGRPPLRGKAIDMVLAPLVGLAFMVSMTMSTSWRVLQRTAEGTLPFMDGSFAWAWDLGATVLPAAMAFLAFLFAYRVLPARQVPMRYLWGGALLATAGFQLIQYGFALYLANFGNFDLIYGSLGGVLALLFWVYLSANMLLAGAEVAAETAHVMRGEPRHGRMRPPARERTLRGAIWDFIVGLVAAPGDSAGPALPDEEQDDEPGQPLAPPRQSGRRARRP